jgi:ribosome maturation factor RimP
LIFDEEWGRKDPLFFVSSGRPEETRAMNETVIEPRLITETGIDARVAAIVEPIITGMGYQLVRVKLSGQNGLTLQIMAERPDGTMTVNDCEALSMAISPALDVEDPIDKAYNLEMSSPGIDRPMVRKSDFRKWVGHLIKCETSAMVEGRKRFRGKIANVTDDGFVLDREQTSRDEAGEITIPFSALAEARLILTDDLIRDALKADKAARAAANENYEDEEED